MSCHRINTDDWDIQWLLRCFVQTFTVYPFCQVMETNETSYDFIVFSKDTGVVQGLRIDGDQ